MGMEGAPNTPQKKPRKTLEAIKKAAGVLAVGTTLAGVPTDANSMSIDGWRRSTNIEDSRTKQIEPTVQDFNSALISNKDPIAHWNTHEPTASLSAFEEERSEPGMFDKDIEDSAKRIKAEIAAEETAQQAKRKEAYEAWKKRIDEIAKEEAEQQPTIIVGQPER